MAGSRFLEPWVLFAAEALFKRQLNMWDLHDTSLERNLPFLNRVEGRDAIG
jgi:hypothetical protein